MSQKAAFNLLCPYQIAWVRENAPLAIGEKSRRIGWTWTHALRETLHLAPLSEKRSESSWHSSADMSASAEFIEDAARWSEMINVVAKFSGEPEVIDEKEGINAFVLRFANGSKLVAGSSNPKFFRSKGGRVGLDEFAFHKQARELYKAAQASALFWGFPCRIWSTHNGPSSQFNQMIVASRAGKLKAKVHTVTIFNAVADGIVERIRMRRERLDHVPDPVQELRDQWLAELRATCIDEDQWNEEFMCIPSSDASSLLSYEVIDLATVHNLSLIDSVLNLPRDKGIYFAGYDVGRKHDYSVLWIAELIGDVLWTRGIFVLDRQTFNTQSEFLGSLMANYRVRRLCIDATGLGMQLAEQAKVRWGSRVEAVTLTSNTKSALGMVFRDRFYDRQIRIPGYVGVISDGIGGCPASREGWLKEDLHKTTKSVTTAGNVRLSASSDDAGHADAFWAGALMVEAASESKATPVSAPQMYKPVGW